MEIISPCTGVLCTEQSDDLDDDGVKIRGEFVDRLEDLEDEEVMMGKQVAKTGAEDVGADEAEEDAVIDDVAEDL